MNRVNASDELAVLRGESDLTKSLVKLFKSKGLTNSPTLTQLVSTVILFVPHNITVENGFSNMKFNENEYQTRFSDKCYEESDWHQISLTVNLWKHS